MKPLKRLFFLLAIVPAAGLADIYKWVDENGVVHYSEQPPEEQEASRVELETPDRETGPSVYQEAMEQQQARKLEREQERPIRASEPSGDFIYVSPERQRCFEAYLAIEDLQRRGDVYEDESGKVHHADSLHRFWYESYRYWLSDSEKRDRKELLEAVMRENCDLGKAQIRKQASAWHRQQSTGSCDMARSKLNNIKGDGKTPLRDIERIEDLIRENCG